MPDVRNCKRCGRIFNYIGGAPLCQACKDDDEDEFKKIKEYLYANPGAPMSLVATELDISVEKIKRFLREGRLEIVGDEPNFVLDCESCGKSIKTGRYCDACEKELASGLRGIAKTLGGTLGSRGEGHRGIGLRYLSKDFKDLKEKKEE